MFKIGCHLSSAGGYLAMGQTARSIGANVFQFFTRNPRGGAAKPIDPADVRAFLDYAEKEGIGPILAHAPYTLNAAGADARVREFAESTMADDLKRLELTPGALYNFHPGSHVGQGAEKGIELISSMLVRILSRLPKPPATTILLETMAGKGSEVGGTFEELRAIIDAVESQLPYAYRLGVCLDTCHVWDGGFDIVGDLDETVLTPAVAEDGVYEDRCALGTLFLAIACHKFGLLVAEYQACADGIERETQLLPYGQRATDIVCRILDVELAIVERVGYESRWQAVSGNAQIG